MLWHLILSSGKIRSEQCSAVTLLYFNVKAFRQHSCDLFYFMSRIFLICIQLWCVVLYCIVLCRVVSCGVALYRIVLYCTVLYCIVLYSTARYHRVTTKNTNHMNSFLPRNNFWTQTSFFMNKWMNYQFCWRCSTRIRVCGPGQRGWDHGKSKAVTHTDNTRNIQSLKRFQC